jgi:hypothetical protein
MGGRKKGKYMIKTNESLALAERIFEAFPVTQPAFAKLLGLLDIEATRDIPTACVTFGTRSRLLVNPDFVEKYCETSLDLSMLVLHELYHVVLGHTRLYQRVSMMQNWAFDAIINAQLCLLFPDPAQTSLFRRLYNPDRFPECLLRPPQGWRTDGENWSQKGMAGEVHRALYTDNSTSYFELFALLEKLQVAGGQEAGEPENETDQEEQENAWGKLLGNHADEDEPTDPELLAEIRSLVAEWPMVEKRSGRDLGDAVKRSHLQLRRRHNAAVGILRKALEALADSGEDGPFTGRIAQSPAEGLLPYRTDIDRRAEVTISLGHEPFFFRAPTMIAGLVRNDRVHVYLDVSGSMDGVIRPLYEAIIPLLDRVAPKIHLFSTSINDISPADLRKGKLETTGGTTIDVVTDHILKGKVRKALIVTDGWVGNIPSAHLEKLRKANVRMQGVITHNGDPQFLKPVHGKAVLLPYLNAN